jgi:glycosyltransferase involved in cell wall biosynthesis
MHALVDELLSRGHTVSVLVSEEGLIADEPFRKKGVIFYVHPRCFLKGWMEVFNPYVYPRRLKNFLALQDIGARPDIVLSFHIFYVAATKRAWPQIPIGLLTGGTIREWYSWLYGHHKGVKRVAANLMTKLAQRIEREALSGASRIFAEVRGVQERLKSDNPGIAASFVLWPTPVAKERFKPSARWKEEVRSEMGISREQVLLLCVGRLQWNKNFIVAIKALAGVKSRDFQLVIVGDGPDREDLQETVNEMNFGDRVKFIRSREDMERLYAAADIFLHPALVEPYGNVVQEAMASGLACVVSPGEYIGFSEFLTDEGNALLADPRDISAWTERLERLIGDQQLRLRLGAAARRLIDSRPDWHSLTSTLLRELGANPDPASVMTPTA